MSLESQKLLTFTKDVSDLPDRPSISGSELKAQFDAAPNELREKYNSLIDALMKTTTGDSGAKNLGATAISGLTGTDMQSLLESLNSLKASKAQETTINVSLVSGVIASEGRGIRIFKDTLGLVHLSIDVDLSSDTSTAFQIGTLPDGYKPETKITQNLSAKNSAFDVGFGDVVINTDGSIVLGTPTKSSWKYIHVGIPAYKPA
jgi:hypothetical protein